MRKKSNNTLDYKLNHTRDQLERSLQRLVHEAQTALKDLTENNAIDEYLGTSILDLNSIAAQYNLLNSLKNEK